MKQITFQIISDIHLEKKKYENNILMNPIKSKYLILAGDIGNPLKNNYKEYLKYCSYHYERTFLISGNHEYWNNTIERCDKLIDQICSSLNNVYYLNNSFYDLQLFSKKIRIYGSTLWSYAIENPSIISYDNKLIKDFGFHKRNALFMRSYLNLRKNPSDIIITHHSPSFNLINKKWKNSDSRYLYASNLDHLLNENKYWICGHLHDYNVLCKNIIINCCHDEYKEKIIYIDLD
jgi:predicted phosphohydrolase